MDNKNKFRKIIDVTEIKNSRELHRLLMKELDFPGFYGMNWDAFWDAIFGLVEMPDKLVIIGWSHLVEVLPDDAEIMKRLLKKLNDYYQNDECDVEYR